MVALRSGALPGALLRAHVTGRPDHRTVRGQGDVGRTQRDAEIRHHHAPVAIDQDVRSLHVAVDDAALVREQEGPRGSLQHEQDRRHRQGALRVENLVEGSALDEFHGDEQDPADLPHPIHRDDVRMLELGDHASFALEALGGARRQAELGREHLERDGALRLLVESPEDDAHAAAGELGLDFEVTGEHAPQPVEQRVFCCCLIHDGAGIGIDDQAPAIPAEPRRCRHLRAASEAFHAVGHYGRTRMVYRVSGIAPVITELTSCTSSVARPGPMPIKVSPRLFT